LLIQEYAEQDVPGGAVEGWIRGVGNGRHNGGERRLQLNVRRRARQLGVQGVLWLEILDTRIGDGIRDLTALPDGNIAGRRLVLMHVLMLVTGGAMQLGRRRMHAGMFATKRHGARRDDEVNPQQYEHAEAPALSRPRAVSMCRRSPHNPLFLAAFDPSRKDIVHEFAPI